MTRKRITTLVSLAALVGAVGAYAGMRSQTPPPTPAADAPNGVVDPTQIPDELDVIGSNGKPVVCSDGKKLKIKKKDVIGAPPVPGTAEWQAGLSKKDSEPTVFRCGPNDKPVRVPASWAR